MKNIFFKKNQRNKKTRSYSINHHQNHPTCHEKGENNFLTKTVEVSFHIISIHKLSWSK